MERGKREILNFDEYIRIERAQDGQAGDPPGSCCPEMSRKYSVAFGMDSYSQHGGRPNNNEEPNTKGHGVTKDSRVVVMINIITNGGKDRGNFNQWHGYWTG